MISRLCVCVPAVNRLSRKPLTGIKISSISQLTDTKTNKGKTAMYYIIQQVDRARPHLMKLPHEFPHVKKCTRVSFPTMNEYLARVRVVCTNVVACHALPCSCPAASLRRLWVCARTRETGQGWLCRCEH